MSAERRFLSRAVERALAAEREGNLPIGTVIVLDDEIVAEGASAIFTPSFDPGRHAEIEALRAVEPELWTASGDMTIYTSLEPCVMCFGAIVLHGIGRVVYGARDILGGAASLVDHLPPYYDDHPRPMFTGPAWPEVCDPLYERAASMFAARARRS